MREFYVLNLDARRIAILAGAALVILGLTLFVGMAVGKGQAERQALRLAAEADAQKMGLVPEVPKSLPETGDKGVVAHATPAVAAAEKLPVAAADEVPLREDPLVQGPPKKKNRSVASARAETQPREAARKTKGKSEKAVVALQPQGTGSFEAALPGRYTIQVAAFRRAAEAQGLIAKLKDEGIRARTERSGTYYLVTVGRSKSKEKLGKALARLKELEYDAYIRKISKPSAET